MFKDVLDADIPTHDARTAETLKLSANKYLQDYFVSNPNNIDSNYKNSILLRRGTQSINISFLDALKEYKS